MTRTDIEDLPLSRSEWMRLLALAPEDEICRFMRPLAASVPHSFLRKPESGLLMTEGRTGTTRFNLGEMLVTRCAVVLNEGPGYQGFAWISGNRSEHAALAALGDALMQLPEYYERLSEQLFATLRRKEIERRAAAAREVAPTRVDFFTMVRGEDA